MAHLSAATDSGGSYEGSFAPVRGSGADVRTTVEGLLLTPQQLVGAALGLAGVLVVVATVAYRAGRRRSGADEPGAS